MVQCLYETVKENAEEIQRKVLAENEFYETEDIAEKMQKRGGDGKPKRIFDPDLTYMMDLEKELPRFIDLCYPEYVKAGIADPRGKEYIPEAEEKELFYEAEKQLVEYGIDIIPDEFGEKETLRKFLMFPIKISLLTVSMFLCGLKLHQCKKLILNLNLQDIVVQDVLLIRNLMVV